MNSMKFSNEVARYQTKSGGKPVKIVKKVTCLINEEAVYHPVRIELVYLLEKTHTVRHEEAIIHRIKILESNHPDSVSSDGIFWQTWDDEPFMLFDERALSAYQDVFEDYLDHGLIENLKNFLEETNRKRLADYEAASETDKKAFEKIIVVKLN